MECGLCHQSKSSFYLEDKQRTYFCCSNCHLIFVQKDDLLSPEEEKEIYDLHENSPEDSGYRNFLTRIFSPLNKKLNPNSHGLDFGCGNGPTLSKMFEEENHKMSLFDTYYFNNPEVFSTKYDFITATEVFEHLLNPGGEIEKLLSCLKEKGYLGVMTKLARDKTSFKTWHYKNDQTHISFFSEETFEWISKRYNLSVEYIGNDVIILQKN